MKQNPYTPPQAELADHPQAAPPGSPVKAVLLGLAVDVGGSLFTGMAILVIATMMGMAPEDIQRAAASERSWLGLISAAIGSVFSVLGGYVCARIGRRPDYKLGYALAGITVTLGLLLSYAGHSLLYNAVFVALTVGSVLLGTKLGRPRR